ncbi:MAG: hypothetical protein IT431_01420 [Phycisphaerales bacterium]|nr:hypothetical protein [Phycisphaerales bacterium]
MALIYCGIDEAGYGPMLGPLCVGFSAFRVEGWDPEGGAPDLWTLLDKAVCRKGRDSRGRIAVADSKKLKLSNQSKTRHPLTHLERGVLAFAGLVGEGDSDGVPRLCEPCDPSSDHEHGRHGRGTQPSSELDSDEALFQAIGVHLDPHPWYAGDPTALPLAGSPGQIAIARNKLALACAGAGVEPLALACIAVGETEFNEMIRTGGSKGHSTGLCFVRYLRRIVERWGGTGDEVRLVCDRHGGRTSYTGMIEAGVRGLGCVVETLEESDRCSRYAIQTTHATSGGRAVKPAAPSVAAPQSAGVSGPMGVTSGGESEEGSPPPSPLPPGAGGGAGEDAPRAGRIHIQFRPEAEEAHLPVALASMTAKLVRELAMARFNRYWCGRVAELMPTAGYVQDARRWLEDVEGVLCDDEREAMVRLA